MRLKLVLAAGCQALMLTGCYIVPAGPEGHYAVYMPSDPPAHAAAPKVLPARLYPENDVATRTGMVSGTVTNLMSGKGRFQLQYAGELLTGEATRVSGDERKGIASAWGPSGAFMSCEYQMHTQLQGAGTCNFSNGARYKVHVGN
jgi:hypothetical protein